MDDIIFKTEIDRCRERIYGNPGKRGKGGMNWEVGLTYTNMYKIDNLDNPLYSVQCSVVS